MVQGYVLDVLQAVGLSDGDNYSSRLTDVIVATFESGRSLNRDELAAVKTSNFGLNREKKRRFVDRITSGIEKRVADANLQSSAPEPQILLDGFIAHVKRQGIDAFWASRGKGILKEKPENQAEILLSAYIAGEFSDSDNFAFRQVHSGTGIIDVLLVVDGKRYVIELKVLRPGEAPVGSEQLAQYLDTEELEAGWLIVFDASPDSSSSAEWEQQQVGGKTVHRRILPINPAPPSSLSRSQKRS